MIAIMVVAHSPLASALVETARYVLGRDPETTAVDVLPDECAVDCSALLARRILDADQGDGVLLLTDLPGASPANIASAASHLASADSAFNSRRPVSPAAASRNTLNAARRRRSATRV